jgi:HSP20 family protein
MAGLLKREAKAVDVFDRFDRLFDEWTRSLAWRRPLPFAREWPGEMIPVDEYRENGDLVIRAEMPGIDPDNDVELTVSDHMLHIEAEHRDASYQDGILEIRIPTPAPEPAKKISITKN